MEVPWKTKNRATIWSFNPTPGHISGENSNLKRYMHPNVHCSTIYNSQDMEVTKMSIDKWMDKKDVVYIYICIYIAEYIYRLILSHKKERKNAICSNMDGPRCYHPKWNKSDKEKYYMISLKCGI